MRVCSWLPMANYRNLQEGESHPLRHSSLELISFTPLVSNSQFLVSHAGLARPSDANRIQRGKTQLSLAATKAEKPRHPCTPSILGKVGKRWRKSTYEWRQAPQRDFVAQPR